MAMFEDVYTEPNAEKNKCWHGNCRSVIVDTIH